MARRTTLAALCGLLLLAIGHTQRAEAQGSSDVLQLVNGVRAEYGLAPVTYNSALAAAAQSHANYIAQQGVYSHYGANGSTWQDRAQAAGYPGWAGENLVGGTGLTPQQGVTWWRNSAVHFSNMLNPRWTEAGVGYAVGNGQNFYVMVFGTPNDAPPRAPQAVVDVPFIVAPIALAAPNPDGSIVHVVGEGHTFWAIAARYEVPLADLYLFNGMNEDSVLNPGDRLTIRLAEGQPPPPTPTPPTTHRVREGESLWVIAAYYKTDLDTLLWLNGLTIDDVVHTGNEVKVRLGEGEAPPPTSTPQQAHIVRSGDTAFGIALQYGLSLDELMAYNGLSSDTLLQIGQQLLIRPPTPTPEPTATTTPTMTPAPVALALAPAQEETLQSPTPRATAANIAANSPPTLPEPSDWNVVLGIGALIVGLGLTLLAGVAVVVLWRQQ